MSPKQWLALACVYISYLFFGASIFYQIEHNTELGNRAIQLQERIAVNELLVKNIAPETQTKVLETLSNYCGRPVTNYTLDKYEVDFEWSFFHSFWFSFIVCSTVGYGNSSPHDQPGQAFLIFYALIGLPLNGFVLAYLGKYFSERFTRIYNQYKGHDHSKDYYHEAIQKFGMIGTIAMLLVPGIGFFIFLPACLFTYFEDWPYVRSVYYSFVTLTTIGFGDFVPTFQDGQARKFGTYFTFYQIFIVVWNFIGVGYFIMIIGFIAKGMHSKRIAHLKHQLSLNIKETQHRIWAEVTKDVNVLRRFLNEVNMMKFRPVYHDSSENETFHSLHRSSSCPEMLMYRNIQLTRKRAYSENCGRLSNASTVTLNRSRSDGDLRRIDRQKTFERSDSLFQTKDLLSNVLTALGSIQPINEDIHSCLEMYSGDAKNTESSYEWTWDGSNSEQIKDYIRNKTNKKFNTPTFLSESELNIDSINRNDSDVRRGSIMSSLNPFKDRVSSQEADRRGSIFSQENTTKRRESRNSLFTSENMELLERTSIADLIRAVDEVENNANNSTKNPLLFDDKQKLKVKFGTAIPRKESLRPVHDYTTIFTSDNMIRESTVMSRSLTNTTTMNTPKRSTKRIRSTSSSIPTVQEHHSSDQSLPVLYRTMSLRPTPLPRQEISLNTRTVPQMPLITVQAPNVSKRNLLWHPDYQDESSFKNQIRRKRSDSK